jgi:hypothetical protein
MAQRRFLQINSLRNQHAASPLTVSVSRQFDLTIVDTLVSVEMAKSYRMQLYGSDATPRA